MQANGVVPVDKPAGYTSRQVVSTVGEAYRASKAGHCGTLDPLATGVLVVCLGRATLLSRYFAAEGKTYEVEALLGLETDTYDIEGRVLERRVVPELERAQLEELLTGLTGEIKQVPPAFSAVKVGGRRLYEYARKGVAVEAEPRTVSVESIEIEAIERREDRTVVRLAISCGSGTYIRSLVHEMGRLLGCGACVSALRRTKAGHFGIAEASGLADLTVSSVEDLSERLISIERATDWMATVVVSPEGTRDVGMGKPLLFDRLVSGVDCGLPTAGAVRVLDEDGAMLAVYGPPRESDGAEVAGRAMRVLRPVEDAGLSGGTCSGDKRPAADGPVGPPAVQERIDVPER